MNEVGEFLFDTIVDRNDLVIEIRAYLRRIKLKNTFVLSLDLFSNLSYE